MIKDLLVLLSIHPEKGWVRRRTHIGYAILAAAFYELALKGFLSIEGNRITVSSKRTGDLVLDDLLDRLERLEGKKYSWSINRFTMHAGKLYRSQMQHLESSHLISSRPIEWLGITWGKRYRVNRSDRLKPLLLEFERVLVYGNNPSPQTRLLIDTLGSIDLLKVFFSDYEIRKRARKRYRELGKKEFAEYSETFTAIRKEFRNTLRVNKAQGW